MSNLGQRVVSGVVMAAAVLVLTWLGGLPFRLLAAAIGAAMFWEWWTMAGIRRDGVLSAALAAGLAAVLVLVVVDADPRLQFAAALCAYAATLALAVFRSAGAWGPLGLAYAALPVIAVSALRGGHDGLAAILFLFAVVWATDIFAYFVGRALGGPKLAPGISPGKTWSGAVGGAVAAVIAGLAVAHAAGWRAGPALAATILALSIASQCGDLFESWVKRRWGAKDSSRLIPGHGGVMDRVDGLVAAAFALYVIGLAMSGEATGALGR